MRRRTLFHGFMMGLLQACGLRPTPNADAPTATPHPQLSMVVATPSPLTTHQLIEVVATVVPAPVDRFDVVGNDLWLEAVHAQQTLRVPLFWYQAGADAAAAVATPGEWRGRVQLSHTGEWQLAVRRGAQQSAPQQLQITAHPQAHGIIGVAERGFAHADGTPFLPIGANLGWSTQQGTAVLADYARWFARLSANGGNVARIWMASWSFGIEWDDTPLGDYTARLPQAWLLDEVLRLAEHHGVMVMLCLVNHGAFSQTTNAEWDANPYNAANGGPLQTPGEFVTDATARTLFARRLRYIGARYAAFPALWCWEWWNEVNWTPIVDTDLAPWLTEMRAVLAGVDPYQHLVTSSWASMGATTLWESDALDFVQHHTYSNDDLVRTLNAARIPVKAVLKTKPLLVSEIGLDTGGVNVPSAVEYVHLTNAIWAPIMLGMAGSGMYWWWDTWIDPTNQWGVFAGIHAFMQAHDYRQMRPFSAQLAHAVVLGLKSDTTVLVWIRHADYTARAAMQAVTQLASVPADWVYQCIMAEWQTLPLTGLTDATYAVSFMDPVTATWTATSDCQVLAGQTTVAVPPFVNAMALQLVRKA